MFLFEIPSFFFSKEKDRLLDLEFFHVEKPLQELVYYLHVLPALAYYLCLVVWLYLYEHRLVLQREFLHAGDYVLHEFLEAFRVFKHLYPLLEHALGVLYLGAVPADRGAVLPLRYDKIYLVAVAYRVDDRRTSQVLEQAD